MTCDLSDPAIKSTYQEILSNSATNWMLMGYRDTRDKITVYSKGSGGIDEFKSKLTDEVLYGFLNFDSTLILITFVSEQVSGVKRARALVHGRNISQLLNPQVQISASNAAELSANSVKARIAATMSSKEDEFEDAVDSSSPPGPPGPAKEGGRDSVSATSLANNISERLKRAEEERLRKEKQVVAERERQKLTEEKARRVLAEKEAEEEQRRLALLKQRMEKARLEGSNLNGKQGYITVQGGGLHVWKRRWFVINKGRMHFYRDPDNPQPASSLALNVAAIEQNAQRETLIPNSFKVRMTNGDTYYFFGDTEAAKMNALVGMTAK